MAYRYLTIKVNGKTKLKHRHIMEQHLGRALLPCEQVHHKDENIRNNEINNLEVLTIAQHMAQHKQKHPLTKQCAICGATFTPEPTKRARAKTCSRECAVISISRTEKATKALIRANFVHEQQIAGMAA